MANIEIEVTLEKITLKAYLVQTLNPKTAKLEKMWLPKSQVKNTDCYAEGDKGTMEITEWIAEQKGLLVEKDDEEADDDDDEPLDDSGNYFDEVPF
jgi:hypothetical protein